MLHHLTRNIIHYTIWYSPLYCPLHHRQHHIISYATLHYIMLHHMYHHIHVPHYSMLHHITSYITACYITYIIISTLPSSASIFSLEMRWLSANTLSTFKLNTYRTPSTTMNTCTRLRHFRQSDQWHGTEKRAFRLTNKICICSSSPSG